MKNDHLPIIQALKGRQPAPKADVFDPMPRTFEVKHSDVPGLSEKKVGTPLSVVLRGKIHMQHGDGHALMHVDSVKPDSDEMAQKENPGSKTG